MDMETGILNAVEAETTLRIVGSWRHLRKDVERHVLSLGGNKNDANFYVEDIYDILMIKNPTSLTTEIRKRKAKWSKEYVTYFESNIEVKLENIARCHIDKYVEVDPESGVTSNQSEGFNWLIKDLNNWKEGPIDAVVLSFHFLQQYFLNEIKRGKAGIGNFTLKEEFSVLQISLEEVNRVTESVKSFKEIVESIKSAEFRFQDVLPESTEMSNLSTAAKAKEILTSQRLSFVPNLGCFVVAGATGQFFTVELFPQEKCSCLLPHNQCCHIVSVKMSLRMNIVPSVKTKSVNLTVLRKKARGSRKPGRKQPRPCDIDYDLPDDCAEKKQKVEDHIRDLPVQKFSTSRQTLTWIQDSFFTSLLSGRILSLKDETGAIFIDRDPKLFSVILNFLRTKDVDLTGVSLSSLKHEAEYFGIGPLVQRLSLCQDLDHSSCGDVLFHGSLGPPCLPVPEILEKKATSQSTSNLNSLPQATQSHARCQSMHVNSSTPRQDITPRVTSCFGCVESRSSYRNVQVDKHRSDSADSCIMNPLSVKMVQGHHNWICISYPHFVCCYRMKDSTGWHHIWSSPHMENTVERVALNAKVVAQNQENTNKMVAASMGNLVQLWLIMDDGSSREIGMFNLNVSVDSLFFIGSQLVAISQIGKIGVWHSMTQHWQIQDVIPITSYDTAGSFLLLGCQNGSIYYIDMQKFPLRMKDNDLLVTELYKDPSEDMVTALSVYLTPKTSLSGNWIEIAYGTSSGTVRVIVQHPETVGHGPQLFQTFTVHRSPVTKVMLSEKHLVSVCSEYNHVRTWSVTRFRGMISTQPGSTPLASFKIVALDEVDSQASCDSGNDFGPYGEQDDQQVFIQKVVPETDKLFVRLSSNGQRVCVISSVDISSISAFCVHECEGSNRMGSRPRRYIFTGHTNGTIQMWDLTTALEMMNKTETETFKGGPSPEELMKLLDQCDLTSRNNTPSISPAPSVLQVPMGPTVSYQRSRTNSVTMDSDVTEHDVGFYPDTLITKI